YSEKHADTSSRKTPMPVINGQRAADEWSEQGTGIDPHVEDRKARISPLVFLCIQIADHLADVRLQETCTDRHAKQAGIEKRDWRKGQEKMAESYNYCPYQRRTLGSNKTVGDPAPDERQKPD